jgi:RNA recognition motif-containing protein
LFSNSIFLPSSCNFVLFSAVEDDEMRDIFSKAGTVKEVTIPRRKDSADSRGFAFIEMASKEDMEKAVQELDGYEFGGRAIQARVSLTKDQLPTKVKKEKSVKRSRAPEGPKVYVGNLPFDVAPDALKELFEKYGEVTNVFLVKDNDGQSRGFGFVAMKTEEDVDAAIAEVDGIIFQGRRLAARRPLAEGEKSKSIPRKLIP